MFERKNLLSHYRNNRAELESALEKKTKSVKLLLIAFCCITIAFGAAFLARLLGSEMTSWMDFAVSALFLFGALNAHLIGLNRLEMIRDVLDDRAAANE